jgi:hypothetical protein
VLLHLIIYYHSIYKKDSDARLKNPKVIKLINNYTPRYLSVFSVLSVVNPRTARVFAEIGKWAIVTA